MKRTQSKADPGTGQKLLLNREMLRSQLSGAGSDPEPFPCTTNSHTTIDTPARLRSIAG